MAYPVFATYKSIINSVVDVHDRRLKIAESGPLQVQYACFDYVNVHARIVIMGITPGESQANEALRTARVALQSGASDEVVLRRAKEAASFAGPMRSNLIRLMDYLRIADGFRISTTASLWTNDANLVHFTSALRYPVFVNSLNYGGGNPKIDASPFLQSQVLSFTGRELEALKHALLIPLGPAASTATKLILSEGKIDSRNVVFGVPHPSGANGERIAYFLERKARADLSAKTNPEVVEQNRHSAQLAVRDFFRQR